MLIKFHISIHNTEIHLRNSKIYLENTQILQIYLVHFHQFRNKKAAFPTVGKAAF